MKKAISLLIASFLLVHHAFSQCDPTADRTALIEFYNAMSGPTWISTQWDTLSPMSTWEDVEVNAQGCVVYLTMTEDNLIGQIPNLNLPYLERLILMRTADFFATSHQLPEFTHLVNLKQLTLKLYSGLNGTVPDLSHLVNLERLDLSNNKLTSIVDPFSLPKLDYLNLSRNNLTSTPDFDLGSLSQLDLGYNLLSSVRNFTGMESLTVLHLSHNNLSGVPDFAGLSNLLRLYLVENQLTSIANFQLPKLIELQVCSNRIAGPPINFEFLSSAEKIDLSWNQMTGDIPNFNSLDAAENIFLNNNQLSGCDELELNGGSDIVKVNDNILTFDCLLKGNNHQKIRSISPQKRIPVNPEFSQYTNSSILIKLDFDEDLDPNGSNYDWFVDNNFRYQTNINELELDCKFLTSDSMHVVVTNSKSDAKYGETLVLTTTRFVIDSLDDWCETKILTNSFTPDGNGINDLFIIHDLSEGSELFIFNRWGDIVFQRRCNTPDECAWDGKHNGKDLPVGTYYYVLKRQNGKVDERDVTLLR